MGKTVSKICNPLEKSKKRRYNPEERISTEESFIQFRTYKNLHNSSFCHFEARINDISYTEWHEKPSRSKENVQNYYIFLKDIGSGFYGDVKKAYLRREKIKNNDEISEKKILNSMKNNIKKRLFAIKNIKKEKFKDKMSLFMREIEFLKILDHPNIIKFYEVYEDQEEIHLVMEYCKGGDLKTKIKEKIRFSENELKSIFHQILRSIAHIHHKKISHRDVKPENFLIKRKNGLQLKLIDFGLSVFYKDTVLRDVVGTPYYMSPEVINGKYNEKCDLWSIGVMFYYFSVGKLPFNGKTKKELFEKILLRKFDYFCLKEYGLSRGARRLLMGLLAPEEARISAVEALNHEFFKFKILKEIEFFDQKSIFFNFKNFFEFGYKNIFQKEVIGMMVKIFIDSNKVKKLFKVFDIFDKSNLGIVKKEDLKKIFEKFENFEDFKKIKEKFEKKNLKENLENHLIKNLYIYEKSEITFSEFIAGMLPKEFYLNEVRLKIIFNYLDSDQNGFLTSNDLKNCFRRFGRDLESEKVNLMMQECEEIYFRGRKSGKKKFDFFGFKEVVKCGWEWGDGVEERDGVLGSTTDF